jgi:predicted HTH transcriptional regulator
VKESQEVLMLARSFANALAVEETLSMDLTSVLFLGISEKAQQLCGIKEKTIISHIQNTFFISIIPDIFIVLL